MAVSTADPSSLKTGSQMCEQCVKIDKKIEHYQRMAPRITDPAMTDGIKQLTADLRAQKLALHPEKQ
jgi:hypothetical protein